MWRKKGDCDRRGILCSTKEKEIEKGQQTREIYKEKMDSCKILDVYI